MIVKRREKKIDDERKNVIKDHELKRTNHPFIFFIMNE